MTQADRRATAGKYVALYAGLKQRRPDVAIGWYMDPGRRDFWRAIAGRYSEQYKAWQSENTDLAQIMAPVTDVYLPSVYFFYTRDTYPANVDYAGMYVSENINEARRVRDAYGKPSSPIYPYVWYRRHDDSRDLDPDAWETIRQTCLAEADGFVAWGGWGKPWDENAPWWVTLKAQLMDKRRTG